MSFPKAERRVGTNLDSEFLLCLMDDDSKTIQQGQRSGEMALLLGGAPFPGQGGRLGTAAQAPASGSPPAPPSEGWEIQGPTQRIICGPSGVLCLF